MTVTETQEVTMFPGAYAEVYRNADGEVTGWSNTAYDEQEYFDCCGGVGRCFCDDYEDDDEDDEPEFAYECRHHDWICGMMVVAKEDLEMIRAMRHRAKERGPHCQHCDIDYSPEIHGFNAALCR